MRERPMRKVLFVSIVFYAITALVYFLSVGQADLPIAWCYFLLSACLGLGTVVIAESKSPGFAQERLRPAAGEQDRVFKPMGTICSFAVLVIAGLDVGRFHWTPAVNWQLQLAAVTFDLLALAL